MAADGVREGRRVEAVRADKEFQEWMLELPEDLRSGRRLEARSVVSVVCVSLYVSASVT